MNDNYPQSLVFDGFKAAITVLISIVFSACSDKSKPIISDSFRIEMSQLVCQSASNYKDRVVGDGHCVSLIKRCAGAPPTTRWRAGASDLTSDLPSGTVIATFKNNRYPNSSGHHAAIYIQHDENGIWVWDQWIGKPVHRRLIRTRNDNASAGNTAQAYRVVLIESPKSNKHNAKAN
ncbi:MAG: BPSL0067 family protein [Arenicella sp.]|nr:BPSL0067 family protein [Arenicella sp.]